MNTLAANNPNELGSVLRFGNCELHVPTREFWRQGQRQPVPRRVFDLLVLLIEQRPRAVGHAEIAQAVWGRAMVRASALAQAVMQARQLVGDAGEEPAVIVSVRGVGYRFAGAVVAGPPAESDAGPPLHLEELQSLMADAEAARLTSDLERAQFLAHRAIVMSQEIGINRERARALSLGSRVAIAHGSLQDAAAMAAQALRLAEAEGLKDIAAEAQMCVARVRLIAGDLHGALAQLHAAYGVLQVSGSASERGQNERLMVLVHREMGQHMRALEWCDRAELSALQTQNQLVATSVRELRVDVTLLLAQACAEQGHRAEAHTTFERALALNEAALAGIEASTDPTGQLAWLGNQAMALAGLDRTDEAWDALSRMQDLLEASPKAHGPVHPLWLSGLHRERALLLAQTRRHTEAVAAIQQAVQVAESGGLRTELPLLLKRASQVFEQAGRCQEALVLLRKSHAAEQALQVERAASLAQALQAEADADTLRQNLQAALQRAQQLALENRGLQERLQQLERRHALSAAGFAAADVLRTVVGPQHVDARAREVPFCVALLRVDNLAELPPLEQQGVPAPWLQALSRAFREVLGAGHDLVHWRPGVFVHQLINLGERRAREACQRAEAQLSAYPWPQATATAQPLPRLRVVCVDAARDDTLEAALQRLMRLAEADTQPIAGDPAFSRA